jgi:hypothetical protein
MDNDEFDLPPKIAARRTIRYADEDIEAAAVERTPISPSDHVWSSLPRLRRQNSVSSVVSERSLSRNVDPALALPAVYRTVSFHITTTQERQAEASKEAAKSKAKAQAGDGTCYSVSSQQGN